MLIAETLNLLMEDLKLWKNNLEGKGLRVNIGKTKVMIHGKGLDIIKPSGKYLFSVCRKGVGRNPIFCTSCDAWVQKKCSGIKGRLVGIPDFRCHRCLDLALPIEVRPVEHVSLGDQKLDCELSIIARIPFAWGKFPELLSLLTNQEIPLKSRDKVYSSCICSVMLYDSEYWALTTADVRRL